MLKVIVILSLAYLCIGLACAVAFYYLTGVAQFGGDVFGPGGPFPPARLARAPEIAVGFLGSRLVVAILDAIALSWCLKRSYPAVVVLAAGISIPMIFEVCVARPYAHSWVGMSWAVLNTWPSVPEHIMPASLVFRTAAAYLGPALLAGLGVSVWAAFGHVWNAPEPSTPAP